MGDNGMDEDDDHDDHDLNLDDKDDDGWDSDSDDELTEEKIVKVNKVLPAWYNKVIKVLRTNSYVDGINKTYDLFVSPDSVRKLGVMAEFYFYEQAINHVLRWLGGIITDSRTTKEEKEMRINQSIFVCFMLLGCDKDSFRRSFIKYVAQFLIVPGSTKQQMVDTILAKLREVSSTEEAQNIKTFLLYRVKCFGMYVYFDGSIIIYNDCSLAED